MIHYNIIKKFILYLFILSQTNSLISSFLPLSSRAAFNTTRTTRAWAVAADGPTALHRQHPRTAPTRTYRWAPTRRCRAACSCSTAPAACRTAPTRRVSVWTTTSRVTWAARCHRPRRHRCRCPCHNCRRLMVQQQQLPPVLVELRRQQRQQQLLLDCPVACPHSSWTRQRAACSMPDATCKALATWRRCRSSFPYSRLSSGRIRSCRSRWHWMAALGRGHQRICIILAMRLRIVWSVAAWCHNHSRCHQSCASIHPRNSIRRQWLRQQQLLQPAKLERHTRATAAQQRQQRRRQRRRQWWRDIIIASSCSIVRSPRRRSWSMVRQRSHDISGCELVTPQGFLLCTQLPAPPPMLSCPSRNSSPPSA